MQTEVITRGKKVEETLIKHGQLEKRSQLRCGPSLQCQ